MKPELTVAEISTAKRKCEKAIMDALDEFYAKTQIVPAIEVRYEEDNPNGYYDAYCKLGVRIDL